jgi:hypothetical protein
MSEVEYRQLVLSGPVPDCGGSAPVLLPMYFWHTIIAWLGSFTMVMPENLAVSP